MAQGDAHDHVFDLGIGVGPVVLRVALLAAVPAVAGFALLRGFLPAPGRTVATGVVGAAGAVVVLELLLAGGLSLPVQTVPLVLGALAGALYAVRSTDARFARLRGLLGLAAPWVVCLAGAGAMVELGRGWAAGDAIRLHTGVVLAMVALAWFAVGEPRRVVRVGAAVVAVALIGGTATAAVLRDRDPVPGVAVAGTVGGAAVTVVPNLPGWNLVHMPAGAAEVGPAPDELVTTRVQPGATGTWAAVRLAPGPGSLWVRHRGTLGSVAVDTGGTGSAPAALLGRDGPECASALLGAMLATGAPALPPCPTERLTDTDAAALREVVAAIAGAGHRTLTVVGDATPRGTAAVALVHRTAREAGLLVGPTGPALVVAGWSGAATALRDGGHTYLAPWLLTAPLLDAGPAHVARYAVGEQSNRYQLALNRGYPGELPSASGYLAWLAGQQDPAPNQVRVQP
jgi:hypothetical protein